MNNKTTIKIKENEYEVPFPNNGQLQDIEFLKVQLSKGKYGEMFRTETMDSLFALDAIDMEAYFSVLIPNLKKDLKVDSIRDLGVKDTLELISIFREQLIPFINNWREIIQKAYSKKNEEE